MTAPIRIELHLKSAQLEIEFAGSPAWILDAEFLRVHSPSAEVRGHGGQGATLQTGKQGVGISHIEIVGNYALKISFTDGHDTGLYSWDYLNELCVNQQTYWLRYLEKLEETGASRQPRSSV